VDRLDNRVDLGTRLHKLSGALAANSVPEMYSSLVSAWDGAEAVVIDCPTDRWYEPPQLPWHAEPVEAMMAWDTLSTLPDEMLTKVDRASMSVGLEVRVPLLDHRVVEAAWRLPPSSRVMHGRGKQPLRQILDRYVPRHLVDRPKTGFDPPIGVWLRGPLREWAEDLLSESRLSCQGLLEPGIVRSRWLEHLSGRRGSDYAIWAVLVFQAWLDGAQTS
jgi:asparagine synthase (glutamine-hydrolysing)